MILYHATTPKKAKAYRHSGRIIAPVRGFTTPAAAMAWAMKTGRTVILEIQCPNPHKLPDHHNQFGEAWWNDCDVTEWKCLYSADREGPSIGRSSGPENHEPQKGLEGSIPPPSVPSVKIPPSHDPRGIVLLVKRPEGYEDVHPELVVADMGIDAAFHVEILFP